MIREETQQNSTPWLSSDALDYLPNSSAYHEMYGFLAELGLVQFWGSTPEHVTLEKEVIKQIQSKKRGAGSISILLCGAASRHSPTALLRTVYECGALPEITICDPSFLSMGGNMFWLAQLPAEVDFRHVQFHRLPAQRAGEVGSFDWITSDALLGHIAPKEQEEMVAAWGKMVGDEGLVSGTVSVAEDQVSPDCPDPGQYAKIVLHKAAERFGSALNGEHISSHLRRVSRGWWKKILDGNADRTRKLSDITKLQSLLKLGNLEVMKTVALPQTEAGKWLGIQRYFFSAQKILNLSTERGDFPC